MSGASRAAPAEPLVRAACAADNDALLALARRCPMDADISLLVERDPDFFALARARGESHTLVAELDAELIGCISSWRRPAWLGGKVTEIGYLGDLRVDPRHRRRRVGWELGRAILGSLDALPPAPYLVATGVGNRAVAPLVAVFGAARPPIARFTSWQLLPVRRFGIPASLDIGAAEDRDEPELVALLDEFHRPRDCAPVFGDGGFRALLARSSGMGLGDYLLARRAGRIVAALGLWDASAVKRTRVVGLPWWLRGACAVARGLGRAGPLRALPQPDTLLKFRYLRHAAHRRGEETAMQALVRSAVNAAGRRNEQFVAFGCADDDPLLRAAAGAPRIGFRYAMVAGDIRPGAPTLRARPAADSWYYDDGALA